MAHGQLWQDETVQALKQGYQEEIERRKELNISDLAQIKSLRARIQELETAGRVVVKRRNVGDLLKAIDALAALLNNTPLEKE